MIPEPPKLADQLLKFFCSPHRLEEVEGDLHEEFAFQVKRIGERQVRLRYWREVLGFARPQPGRRSAGWPFAREKKPDADPKPYVNSLGMIRNYVKIAVRNLINNKGYSVINIGGLAVGMAIAMLIGLWMHDELSFNTSHKNYNRIAQVMHRQTLNSEVKTGQGVPIPLAAGLRTHYGSEFKHIVLSSWTTRHVLAFGDAKFTRTGNFMSPEAPEVLSLTMLKGTQAGLKEPASILLSESTAKALFGGGDPMNKLVKIDNKLDVKVTGVYEDLPDNTDFQPLRFVAPWDLYVASTDWVKAAQDQPEWGNNSFQIFVQLADKADLARVSGKIKTIKTDLGDKEELKFKPEIFLHPMSRWHLYSEWANGVSAGGRIQFVWLFGIIGTFVLVLACINFMNLATARSEKRAKEVGIRKAIGSARWQLVSQFFSESMLVVAIAFGVSLLLAQLLLPVFNEVADKKMVLLWSAPWFWAAGLGFSLLTGLLAGSYPAFYLSSFQPIKTLKGARFRVGRMATLPRQVLVVLQFTVSITLIIGTVVVYRQVLHAKNRPIGYTREGLLSMHVSTPDLHDHYDAVRDALLKSGTVTALAESQSPTTDVWSNNTGFTWAGKSPGLQADFATVGVSHDFGKTVGWQFVDGRDFSRAFASDSSGLVLNETAARFMGMKHPVGETIQWNDRRFKVIGVVKDMLMASPYEPVKQTIYFIPRRAGNFVTIRINPGSSANAALTAIEAVVKKYSPTAPFNYDFVDAEFALKFATEERIGKLASFITALAIFISCLGLFGLASFIAEQRTKEIGIRKVLGASVANLWGLLSKDFVVLVLISCLISAPIAYYFLDEWLQKYEYRTELSGWIFIAAGLGALGLTVLTVSYQAIKAALMNPVKSLRSE